MTLDEYFRLPPGTRLNRKDIADKLKLMGHSITSVAIGNWIKANKIPSQWVHLIEPILNESLKENYNDDLKVTLKSEITS